MGYKRLERPKTEAAVLTRQFLTLLEVYWGNKQVDMAKSTGISQALISKIFLGKIDVSGNVVRKLADYGIDMNWLLGVEVLTTAQLLNRASTCIALAMARLPPENTEGG